MALPATGIRKALAREGHELPVVAIRVERKLDNLEGVGLANLAVGPDDPEGADAPSASAHHELADAPRPIRRPALSLGRETLVVVAGNHYLGSVIVEDPERGLRPGIVDMLGPRAKDRVVPVG